MKNEKQTWTFPVPWKYTVGEDGTKTLWSLILEFNQGSFNGLYDAFRNFVEIWNHDFKEALELDYVFSIQPCNDKMPVDEEMLALPKFINEPSKYETI